MDNDHIFAPLLNKPLNNPLLIFVSGLCNVDYWCEGTMNCIMVAMMNDKPKAVELLLKVSC